MEREQGIGVECERDVLVCQRAAGWRSSGRDVRTIGGAQIYIDLRVINFFIGREAPLAGVGAVGGRRRRNGRAEGMERAC